MHFRAGFIAFVVAASTAVSQELPRFREVVVEQPFTATSVTTTYQKLPDGTRIEHVKTEQIARDSRGSQWYQFSIDDSKDPLRKRGKKYTVTVVWDATTHQRIDWCDCNHVAWVKQYGNPMPVHEHKPLESPRDVLLGPRTDLLKFHLEALPPQNIQGLEVDGTRAARVVPAGADGNDHDLTTTIINWYSPRLHQNVVVITDDWKTGYKKYELKDVLLSEPDPSIFQVPPGYKIRRSGSVSPELNDSDKLDLPAVTDSF